MTVRENIHLVLRIRYALDPGEWSRRALESLELVDLVDAADKHPRELSGGMNKRAAMARAIATRPRYIIYDEPTTGLDPVLAVRANRLIKNLNEDLGVTALVVTHDVRHVPDFADRVVMISGGTVAAEVPADELWNTEEPTLARFLRAESALRRRPACSSRISSRIRTSTFRSTCSDHLLPTRRPAPGESPAGSQLRLRGIPTARDTSECVLCWFSGCIC